MFGLDTLLPVGGDSYTIGASWVASVGGTALGDWPFKLYTTSKWS
jgi:hypothetical protein